VSTPSPRRRELTRFAIANRGDAALRFIRAVRDLRSREGTPLETVALYTEAERTSAFVRRADRAVSLGPDPAAYLRPELLLACVARAGADAVWPGWGFLSEDADFAAAVERAGAVFLGPRPDTLRQLGNKIAARRHAAQLGIPVIPAAPAPPAGSGEAIGTAVEIGFPLVVKAACGGGGRGIRRVDHPDELTSTLEAATAEAEAAFGDCELLLERLVESARHIEVQIVADEAGVALALGLRDCSVQRRHQKIVEEAPPCDLSLPLRKEIEDAALRIARSVGYVGAGTVEFLVVGEQFFFLEVNPRLQVEHGVTEALTGLDLVELQIRIARGESLCGLRVEEHGHAIEARLCAEDSRWTPRAGRIVRFEPDLGRGARIDVAYEVGDRIPEAFDSLVAKLIVHADDREAARRGLVAALSALELVVAGGATNQRRLIEVLESEDFRRGRIDTPWLELWTAQRPPESGAAEALAAAALLVALESEGRAAERFLADAEASPFRSTPPPFGETVTLSDGAHTYGVEVFRRGPDGHRLALEGCCLETRLEPTGAHDARLLLEGRPHRLLHDVRDGEVRVELDGVPHRFQRGGVGEVRAGTPALVVTIAVQEGDRVERGEPVARIEVMKAEIAIGAPLAGVVASVHARPGQHVRAEDVLLAIEAPRDEPADGHADRIRFASVADPVGDHPRDAPLALRVLEALRGDDLPPTAWPALAGELAEAQPDELSGQDLDLLIEALSLYAHREALFDRAPQTGTDGRLAPSSLQHLRGYLGALGRGDADSADAAYQHRLARVLGPLQTSGVPPDGRSLLRLVASRHAARHHERLAAAILDRLLACARALGRLPRQAELVERLGELARLDLREASASAIETLHVLEDEIPLVRCLNATAETVGGVLQDGPPTPTAPHLLIRQVASLPEAAFRRACPGLREEDPFRRSIAQSSHLFHLYAPHRPTFHSWIGRHDAWLDRIDLSDGRRVLAASGPWLQHSPLLCALLATAREICRSEMLVVVDAVELMLEADAAPCVPALREAIEEGLGMLGSGTPPFGRLTIGVRTPDGDVWHETLSLLRASVPFDWRNDLHGIHPEAAGRIELHRLRGLPVRRLPSRASTYVFRVGEDNRPEAHTRVHVDARGLPPADPAAPGLAASRLRQTFFEGLDALRSHTHPEARRLGGHALWLFLAAPALAPKTVEDLFAPLGPAAASAGIDEILVALTAYEGAGYRLWLHRGAGDRYHATWRAPPDMRLQLPDARRRRAHNRGLLLPEEVAELLVRAPCAQRPGNFREYTATRIGPDLSAVPREDDPPAERTCAICFGVVSTPTHRVPEGMRRVAILSDPTVSMGSLAHEECDAILAAIDLADQLSVPVEWIPISSGARIAMDSGTENLDATARVVRRIVSFTQAGGTIHVVVDGVNVGAQSYFNALSGMLMHTRGCVIMTPRASLVLTGRTGLEISGGVLADDEIAIGGFDPVMGPNGEAHYLARDLEHAIEILYQHYDYTYVVPGERFPRVHSSADPIYRDVSQSPYRPEGPGDPAGCLGDVLAKDADGQPSRLFRIRPLMQAIADRDGGHLERWAAMRDADSTVVWDARLGGIPLTLVGIESDNLPRRAPAPGDGPPLWTARTLFPASSKKLARALNAASGNRPALVLANLSGFDGSPESMRGLQLEYGAEIARAVVNFQGPIVVLVVSRFHGGAYVVFSRALHPQLHLAALRGARASVIGGAPAAALVFRPEVQHRTDTDPRLKQLEHQVRAAPSEEGRRALRALRQEVCLEKQAEIAAEFDAIHDAERARRVGSIDAIVGLEQVRPHLIGVLSEAIGRRWREAATPGARAGASSHVLVSAGRSGSRAAP